MKTQQQIWSKRITDADLEGFSGHCSAAAIAINDVLFDGKGLYVGATNKGLDALGVDYIGHVGVLFEDRIYDAEGIVEDENVFQSWGIPPDDFLDGYEDLTCDKDSVFDSDAAEISVFDEGRKSRTEASILKSTGSSRAAVARNKKRLLAV